jgi:Uma2 family endonuclease
MTVDQFLAWAQDEPGRHELLRGQVHAMSPEVVGHTKIKGAVYAALLTDIRRRGLSCHVLTDGATVRIDDTTAFEPDGLVYCGQELALSSLEVPNPVIVVEVSSPSTRHIDLSLKLTGYFRLPSVAHYLIVDPMQPVILHHARGAGDDIRTRVVTEGRIQLDPPGLEFVLADVYGT